jgi:hypothetical protein
VLNRRVSAAWFVPPLFSFPSTFLWASSVVAYRSQRLGLAWSLADCAQAYARPALALLEASGAPASFAATASWNLFGPAAVYSVVAFAAAAAFRFWRLAQDARQPRRPGP